MTEKRFELVEAIYNEIGKHQIEIMDNLEKHIVEKHKVVDLINSLYEENEQLRKSEKINMDYAEQIVEENHKLRIAKNHLQRENEQLKKENERKTNEIKLLRKAYSKIPKGIREVWKE